MWVRLNLIPKASLFVSRRILSVMKCSRFRTLLFTFTLGLAIADIYERPSEYLQEIPVNVPKIQSDTPIIIRLCPELSTPVIINKFYHENGHIYFDKEKGIDCTPGGGGGA